MGKCFKTDLSVFRIKEKLNNAIDIYHQKYLTMVLKFHIDSRWIQEHMIGMHKNHEQELTTTILFEIKSHTNFSAERRNKPTIRDTRSRISDRQRFVGNFRAQTSGILLG